ncbi:MAG: hypothetical protein IJX30_00865 [Clostridia bacterium]|nr:hypothetical protein [Clostridia bacterium]
MRKDTIKFADKGEVNMIAHRGLSGLERENTCAAFVAAGQRSYYGIETDIRLTSDGKFIILHDEDLKRVAGVSLNVAKTTFDELRGAVLLDLDGKPRWDLRMPSLEDYLRICKKYDKQAILEIKIGLDKPQIAQLLNEVKASGWLPRTTFISFGYDNLLLVKERVKTASVQFLTDDSSENILTKLIKDGVDADFWEGCVTEKVVATLHKAGRKVNVWTVDEIKNAKKYKDMGVDFITTNILE